MTSNRGPNDRAIKILSESPLSSRQCQLQHEVRGGDEARLDARLGCLQGKGACDVRLADTGGTQEHDVLGHQDGRLNVRRRDGARARRPVSRCDDPRRGHRERFALPLESGASPIARFRRRCGLSIEPAAENDQKVKRAPTVGAMLLLL